MNSPALRASLGVASRRYMTRPEGGRIDPTQRLTRLMLRSAPTVAAASLSLLGRKSGGRGFHRRRLRVVWMRASVAHGNGHADEFLNIAHESHFLGVAQRDRYTLFARSRRAA